MAQRKIPKEITDKIQSYIHILKTDKLPITSVYLFGSYAKGNPSKWSDIDICVVSPKFTDPWFALRYLWKKTPSIQSPRESVIEPVGFSPKDFKDTSPLIDEIKRTGVRVM